MKNMMRMMTDGVRHTYVSSVSHFKLELDLLREKGFNGHAEIHPDDYKRYLNERTIRIADQKTEEAIAMLLGERGTQLQQERYKRKYERALRGDFDETTNSVIIQKHEAFLTAVDQLVDSIETVRMKLMDAVDAGKFEQVESLLPVVEKFDKDTTQSEIVKLLEGL